METEKKATTKTPRDFINECRAILGASRSDTFYDLRMTEAERSVLLRAAKLPDTSFYKARKFSDWASSEQEKIRKAAKNAQNWANGLEVGA